MADPTETVAPQAAAPVAVPSRKSSIKAVAAMIIGIVFIFWSSDAFLDFAATLSSNAPLLHSLDVGIHDWCVTHRSPALNLFFVTMTTLGGPVVVSLIAAVVAVVLWIRRRRSASIFLVTTVALGYGLDLYLKHHYARARPDVTSAVRGAHGYSFPSGHAMGSAFFLGALVYLLIRTHKKTYVKVLFAIAAALLLAAVSCSRVYLGVHWPTDVVAGAGLGITWLIAMIIAQESLELVRGHRKHKA